MQGSQTDHDGEKGDKEVYKCYPPSENKAECTLEFTDICDAAMFLLLKPDWGIRMNPGSAIKYKEIAIAR